MTKLTQVFIDTIILVVVVSTVLFVYHTYKEPVVNYLFGTDTVRMSINGTSINVKVADSPAERQKGLSGVEQINNDSGKLFIFDEEGFHGMWMKDMLFPIDIIWINNSLEIVHIEKNVQPDSYPTVYTSPVSARFVLEVNAFFADTFNIYPGVGVSIPAHKLPADLK